MRWPIAPMKAAPAPLPRGEAWMYEPKWDGHRALVRVRADGRVDVASSTGISRIEQWPWFADLSDQLDTAGSDAAGTDGDGDWILDGEVVAMDDDGRHAFHHVGRPDRPHAFVAFDLLAAAGADLQRRPWHERRALLEAVLRPTPRFMLTPVTSDADGLLAATQAMGYEGVIAKRRDSLYQAGRRASTWVKVKHRAGQDLVVGGYLVGNGARAGTFGSLLVGVHDGGALRFAGGVGTGFDDRTLRSLRSRLDALADDACPFEPEPKLPRGAARWVRPELVVQVEFAEWTETGHLRHPVYVGVRDDVDPTQVGRDT